MSLERDVRLLARLDPFAGFEEDQLKLLAFNATRATFATGEKLFDEGGRAMGAYVIVSGEVELRRAGPDGGVGQWVGQGVFGSGTILGELALITETRRPARAIALGPVETIEVPRAVFRRVLEEYPQTALALHERLAARLGRAVDEIGQLRGRFD